MKSIKNFIESLSKKQLLTLLGVIPLGFSLGIALRIGLTAKKGELDKYNTNTFSIVDSLKKDTIFAKKGELYTDTLIDYYQISKKDIKFETFHYSIRPIGFLSIHDEGISGYKLLENGVLSEEIIEKNNEDRNYYLTGNFLSGGFKLNKLCLMKYGTTSNFLEDSFNINISPQKNTGYEIYTRDTDLGNKILDNEQAEVKRYLDKIKEYKKIKGLWKD